jgi:hypothetical protein
VGVKRERLIPHVQRVAERAECLRQTIEADARDYQEYCVTTGRVRPCGDPCRCEMLARAMMSITIASTEMQHTLAVVEGRR